MPRPPFHRPGMGKKKYNYVPPPSSGAHVILVSMLKTEREDLVDKLTKQQVLDSCAKFSQNGLRDGSKIWASMKGLIDKSLVGRFISRDPCYWLTDEGRDLAQKLISLADGTAENADSMDMDENSREPVILSQGPIGSQQSNSNSAQCWLDSQVTFELKADTYDIFLVHDQREKIKVISPDGSIKLDERKLSCGDYIWVARPKGIRDFDKTRDLVLDYVVERKRLDDLQSSIFDGRFEQQKMRLRETGVRRPLFLIEDCNHLRESNLTSTGLAQAITTLLINDGFDVEKVKSAQHSNDYLISMTKCLEKFYRGKDLRSCTQSRLKSGEAELNEMMTFAEFQTKGAKIVNWTVREMFAKHLVQIKGMSEPRVAVIIKAYPTISHLLEAYRKCQTDKEREGLLAIMKIPDSNRTIGPVLSKRVYTCYAMPPDLAFEAQQDESS